MKKIRFTLQFLIVFLLTSLVLTIIIPNFSNITLSAQKPQTIQNYGININYFDNPTGNNAWQNPNWINGLVDSGAKWVRFETRYYNQTIYETNSSKLNLNPLEMCKLVKTNGLKTLAILNEKVSPYEIDHFSAIKDLNQWQNIVKGQLDGYGKYLDAVEMWNEPDLVDQQTATANNWYMDGSPEHYVDMLKILFEEVQNYNEQNNSDIKTIAGSLGTVRTWDFTKLWSSGGFFLQSIVNLDANSYCDYFSIHVYDGYLYPNGDTEENEGLFDLKDAYQKAQNIVGDKPIWITEVGANHAFTEATQSQFMTELAFEPLKQTDCPMAFWYCYYNPRIEVTNPIEPLHGLVNQDDNLTKRKHYTTFQNYALGLSNDENSIPEFPSWLIMPLFVIATLVLVVPRKILKTKNPKKNNPPKHNKKTSFTYLL